MALDLHDRLRASEESRRRAWRVLEELRAVLEILGDARIPRENQKLFRAEGDRLLKALVQTLVTLRSLVGRLDARSAYGLTPEQIEERKDRLRKLRAFPDELQRRCAYQRFFSFVFHTVLANHHGIMPAKNPEVSSTDPA
jgi:hypothetical protein